MTEAPFLSSLILSVSFRSRVNGSAPRPGDDRTLLRALPARAGPGAASALVTFLLLLLVSGEGSSHRGRPSWALSVLILLSMLHSFYLHPLL